MTEQSPAELEQDAERVRAQIADTAEHLKDKMSPGQLMDEVVNYLKDGDASQFMTNLKTQVRDNPLALAMIGGGLAWLMTGSGTDKRTATSVTRTPGTRHATQPGLYGTAPASRTGSPTGQDSVSGRPELSSVAGSATSSSREGSGVAAHIGDAANSVRASATSAAVSVSDSVHAAGDSLRAGMHDARDAAGERLSSAADAGADLAARARTTFLDVLEREPLVLGAIGVAVGAAIGAMLPTTRVEQEYLGEASAQARKQASDAFSEGAETARHVAEGAYSAARDEADRQGLMPGGTPVAERVAAVAKAAGDELKSAKDHALHGSESSTDIARNREPETDTRTGPKA